MIPYFLDDATWARVKPVLYSWLGTPHHHLWAKKGRGADCALFIAGLLLELGVLRELKLPEYPCDWFLNSKKEVIKEAFIYHSCFAMNVGFALVEVDDAEMRGDILGFATVPKIGTTNHTGIYIPEEDALIHCVRGQGVKRVSWGDSWKEKLSMHYRVMVS